MMINGAPKIAIKSFPEKGRGLVAIEAIEADELIVRSPVRVLSDLEYQILRLMPAVEAFVRQSPDRAGAAPIDNLFYGLDALLTAPDNVLQAASRSAVAAGTIMHTFTWADPARGDQATAAIAFGLASMCNHAPDDALSNAFVREDFEREEIELIASHDIASGDEILIRYKSVPFDEVR